MEKLKPLLKMRDDIARLEDESRHYVMPNDIIFKILNQYKINFRQPKTAGDIIQNIPKLSPVLHKYLSEIIHIMQNVQI